MENRNDILNELTELSPFIAAMEKVNVFIVPEGYFEKLSENILTGIAGEKTGGDSIISNSSSNDIPRGYFDTLPDTILGKIKAQNSGNASVELSALSQMLYSIRNENVFEVPKDYFDTLAETIISKLKPQQIKVVTMHRRSNTFVKYAVAAAFTGVVALGVFTFTNRIKENIDPVIAQGIRIANEDKFDEELAKINDADIVKFLEAGGSDVRSALVANSVDENELPSQEDYLIDEKTLDKYLNSINVNGLKN